MQNESPKPGASFEDIPPELWLRILKDLPFYEWVNLMQVCQRMRTVAQNNILWKKYYPELTLEDDTSYYHYAKESYSKIIDTILEYDGLYVPVGWQRTNPPTRPLGQALSMESNYFKVLRNVGRNPACSLRFVNLKYIIGDEWIFFSNYKSPKAKDFESHDQISALIFWESINIQIRLKAKIFKSSKKISDDHFMKRSKEKNSLAISSSQSQIISSYEDVKEKYFDVFKSKDPLTRPSYWGGYSFSPYEIEFWKGSEFRLNKRDLFTKNNGIWIHQILEP